MATKAVIVKNWLPRYTGTLLNEFGEYILLTNFGYYVSKFAERFDVEIISLSLKEAYEKKDEKALTFLKDSLLKKLT